MSKEKIIDNLILASCIQLALDQSTYLQNTYKYKPNQLFKEWQRATDRLLKGMQIEAQDEVLGALNQTCTIIREQNL
jgi:hypothetical protein